MRPTRTPSRQVALRRQLLLAVRRAGLPAGEPAPAVPVAPSQQGAAGRTTDVWHELTARQVALCRRDRQRWEKAMERADELQEQGLPPTQAVGQALDEAGA